jgi:hypothetical protein
MATMTKGGSSGSEYHVWAAMHPHLGKVVVRLLVMLGTPKSSAYARAIKWGLYGGP